MPTTAAALAAILVAAWMQVCSRAAQCPPLQYRTVDAECRWVLGRLVSCDAPATPGTKAFFACKPLYRLPLSLASRASNAEMSVCREDGTWAPMPFTCVPECGRVVGKGTPLIQDGQPVLSALEYPWHVAVYDRKHKNGVFQVCGGTLITPKFFVSAAHCFSEPQMASSVAVRMRPPAHFAAAVGKIVREWDFTEDTAQKRDIVHIHTHGYGGARLNFVRDFALVEMAVAVELTTSTMPACVDWGLQAQRISEGDVGTVVGWGTLWKAHMNRDLQSASLPFVPKEKCLQLIPPQLVQYILLNDDRFCAGLTNGTTVAQGDSGGGLAFRGRDGRWFLQGVVSVGIPERKTLTAFTNVTSFVRWMADRIQDEEIRASAAEHEVPLEIPAEYTASELEEEQRLAYFREDLGLSLHHMHWHTHYPSAGTRREVDKDRRGELLFYMHHQIIARYNGERMSNEMPRVKRLALREPIKEGYYPKLDNLVGSRSWPGRPPNAVLKDLNRDGIKIVVSDLERWAARIHEAIDLGSVVNATGGIVRLTEEHGMNLLGNIVESTELSPNRKLYGELLNQGHILISLVHDPENRFLESFGVMGDAAVALRDPIFYRWQSSIQDFARQFKLTLPSYTTQQLMFPDVTVRSVNVRAEKTQGVVADNELLTHWQASDLELSRGLDFSPRPPLFARITHLQHLPFTYTIRIDNTARIPKDGHVRIFMAPKNDERDKAMSFEDQRHLMIEMDKFRTRRE
ncbi:hypothetical protein ONE63_005051 [Megalurothrips usitatus]|uniref:Peptidase S1 domain-containing protein n=1 Tax=Megalurothrips usitatus TaxID=439358 RepID=A0AAV7X4S5_9NEOP|nr:hypothetical protein ONE63_005051 [Megalurothrips usitatus]